MHRRLPATYYRRVTTYRGTHMEVTVTQESASPATATMTQNQNYVEVRLPADGAYLSVLRTATAGLAARLDFTLDEIEDLRIAVDEACALLLRQPVADSPLTCLFNLTKDGMEVTVSAATINGQPPARDNFAWTVLTALAGDVKSFVDDEKTVHITLWKRRSIPGAV